MHILLLLLILRVKLLEAILHDIASGDNADKGVLIIYDRYKVLTAGPAHQLVHTGVDPDRYVVFAAGYFHNAPCFG